MKNWSHLPFVKLTVPLCLGIAACHFCFAFARHLELIQACTLALFFALLIIQFYGKRLRNQAVNFAWFTFLFLFLTGYLSLYAINQKKSFRAISSQSSQIFIGKIEKLESSGNIAQILLNLSRFGEKEGLEKPIIIQAFLRNASELMPGDWVAAKLRFNKVEKGVLDLSFNYANYLANKGVYYQVFADSLRLISKSKTSFNPEIYKRRLISFMQGLRIEKENLALLKALIIADKSDLEREQKEQFAQAGIMHLLAVSGLHVGILYLILNQILIFLDRGLIWRILKSIVILATLWFFALLCGMGPSVKRASFMFSMVLLGNVIQRNSPIINAVCASAFILLIDEASLLFDAGFQLSYSAVFGILLIQPRLSALFNPSNLLLKKVIDLTSVSLAAQLGTLPISLYYFHQFPTWFLVTNLMAIPLSFILVSLFILVLILGKWALYLHLDLLLNYVIKSLVWVARSIEYLPYSSLKNIYLSELELIGLFGLLFLFVVRLYRQFSYFYSIVLVVLIAFLSGPFLPFAKSSNNFCAIYSSRQSSILMATKHGEAELHVLSADFSTYDLEKCKDHLLGKGFKVKSSSRFFQIKEDSNKVLAQLSPEHLLLYCKKNPKNMDINQWTDIGIQWPGNAQKIFLPAAIVENRNGLFKEQIVSESEHLITMDFMN